MFTPSFRDSDGDGVGDIPGITEQISNLERLSVQTLWPRPVLQGKAGSWDPSDATNHDKVDTRLGTDADFDALIQAAHSKGEHDFGKTSINAQCALRNAGRFK